MIEGRKKLAKLLKEPGAQAQLCRDARISAPHLSLYLSGKRKLSIEKAKDVQKATGIPATELLGLEAVS